MEANRIIVAKHNPEAGREVVPKIPTSCDATEDITKPTIITAKAAKPEIAILYQQVNVVSASV